MAACRFPAKSIATSCGKLIPTRLAHASSCWTEGFGSIAMKRSAICVWRFDAQVATRFSPALFKGPSTRKSTKFAGFPMRYPTFSSNVRKLPAAFSSIDARWAGSSPGNLSLSLASMSETGAFVRIHCSAPGRAARSKSDLPAGSDRNLFHSCSQWVIMIRRGHRFSVASFQSLWRKRSVMGSIQ